jgi:tetratricopeptide (TPR) repeat protein
VNPRFADALRDRARLYKENNRPDLALGDFSRARDAYDIRVSRRPEDLELLTLRADSAYEARRWRDAISDYSKVIERDPKMALAYERRARAYGDTGDFAAGLADAQTALKLDSHSRNARFFRAYLNRALGDYEAALKDYNELTGDKDDGTANLQRALVYFCMGKYAEAEADFRKYLESHSSDVWIHNWVHVVRAKRGLADDPAYTALAASPLDRLSRYEIANMFRGKTPFQEVSARMMASRSDPAQKANWPCGSGFFLGEYKLEHGDPVAAKTYLEEVVSLNCPDAIVPAAAAELKRLSAK